MYHLCTAEKPSVAKDIARIVGADIKRDGYYEGNGYLVTWALGHLVELAEPEEYGYIPLSKIWSDDNRQAALSELPFFPDEFILKPKSNTKRQFEIIKSLFHRDDVDLVIDCGDMGPEGHILQWFIRKVAGCDKPVKRFCATSLTDESIRNALNNLRPIEEFYPVIKGEFCKKKADWIMGMSLSRAASLKYHAHVDVGRVQSPTLFFIVKRYLDNTGFKPHNYFALNTIVTPVQSSAGSFKLTWQKDKDHLIQDKELKDEEDRLISGETASSIALKIQHGGFARVTACESKTKAEERPQLYDITELQRDGNRLFCYSAAQTLAAAQSLYETHKVLSYPRTDSRFITSDLAPYMNGRVMMIGTHPAYHYAADAVIKASLKLDKRIVDDSKVTDHHALIVTEKIQGFDMNRLTPTEKNILHLVMIRMLTAFSFPARLAETHICAETEGGYIFSATSRSLIYRGWKDVQNRLFESILGITGKDDDESDSDTTGDPIPNGFHIGDRLKIENCYLEEKKTSAPPLHTEATLLTAMENAGAKLENGAILKGKGIGTQATRAEIIKGLFAKAYIRNEKKGKTNYLVPTKLGLNVIKALPKELYSPRITADWETKIAEIVSGKSNEADFMRDFSDFITKELDELNRLDPADLDFTLEKETLGYCPWCNSDVYEGKSKEKKNATPYYYCSKNCGFFIRSDNPVFVGRTQKKLDKSRIKILLTQRFLSEKCISKTGREYYGTFTFGRKIISRKEHTELVFDYSPERTR